MDLDLRGALHDAARTATATRPAIDAAPVVHRIHRRRAVRHAVEGTVGVAAAGAVAVGAVQVTGLRSERVQPVAASPTTGPTPEPSPRPPAWAVVTPVGDFACGLAVPPVDDPAGAADVRLQWLVRPAATDDASASTADGAPATSVTGTPLRVDPVLVNGTERGLRVAARAAQVWFAQAGTVVGRLAADQPVASTDGALDVGPGSRTPAESLTGIPTGCTPDADTGPLPPGEYEVHLVQALRLDDDALTVTGTPVRVVLEPGPTAPDDGPDGGAPDGTGPDTVGPEQPAVDRHPDLAELVISPAGLGPLAVGVPPSTNPGAAMIELDPDLCAEFDTTEPARWVPSGYPPVERDGEPRPAFHVAADETAVSRIDVLVPQVRTAEGVGIGTTSDDLRATYPRLDGPHDGPLSRVWWITGPTGTLVFETQGDEGGLQPAGTPARVVLMRVLQAGADPRFAAANSDDIAGGCL